MKTLPSLLVLAFTAGTCAAHEIALPHVTAFGTAVTEAAPDLLRWRLFVRNKGGDVATVADKHSQIVAAALTFLKAQGIAESETQTSNMQLSENWEYRSTSRVMEGYHASTEIAFTSKDQAAYRALWSGLSELAGVEISASTWDTSKRIELQNSTRVEALEAARTKAQAMAAALGARTAEPLVIEEIVSDFDDVWGGGNRVTSNVVQQMRDDGAESGDAVAPGAIPIRVRVKVVFRLISE